MDYQTQQGNYSAHITADKIQTQNTTMKDLKIKKPKKVQEHKPVNNFFGNVETSKKVLKEFKKRI